MSCEGPGSALLDPGQLVQLPEHYAQIVATYGLRDTLSVCGIGWIECIIPDQGEDAITLMEQRFRKYQAGDTAAANGDDDVPFDPKRRTRNNYRTLVRTVGGVSQQHELYFQIVLSGAAAGALMTRRGDGDRDSGAALILHEEADALREALKGAQIMVGPLLTPRELAAALRIAFMPEMRPPRYWR